MATNLEFSLIYTGLQADTRLIDLYDAAEALEGFQRSLALTTHLAINGEIITQAPALRGARIYAVPPQDGSWKVTAVVVASIYTAGETPKDSPIGHLISSLYDYVISETLGFHLDYSKSLGQQIEEAKKEKAGTSKISESKVDSLIEKIEKPVQQMHRPIVASKTATEATILNNTGLEGRRVPVFNAETFDYVTFTSRQEKPVSVVGRVSSYNVNTFKGRLFTFEHERPIPFILVV